jgi:hypothetical protein
MDVPEGGEESKDNQQTLREPLPDDAARFVTERGILYGKKTHCSVPPSLVVHAFIE